MQTVCVHCNPLAKQLCCGLAHVVYRCLQSVAGLGGGWTCGKNRTGVTALGNNCSYVRRFVFEIHLISVRVIWVRAFILWPHSRCQHWTREKRSLARMLRLESPPSHDKHTRKLVLMQCSSMQKGGSHVKMRAPAASTQSCHQRDAVHVQAHPCMHPPPASSSTKVTASNSAGRSTPRGP